jgi:hypothetical protein
MGIRWLTRGLIIGLFTAGRRLALAIFISMFVFLIVNRGSKSIIVVPHIYGHSTMLGSRKKCYGNALLVLAAYDLQPEKQFKISKKIQTKQSRI